jgi:hypothetical protein
MHLETCLPLRCRHVLTRRERRRGLANPRDLQLRQLPFADEQKELTALVILNPGRDDPLARLGSGRSAQIDIQIDRWAPAPASPDDVGDRGLLTKSGSPREVHPKETVESPSLGGGQGPRFTGPVVHRVHETTSAGGCAFLEAVSLSGKTTSSTGAVVPSRRQRRTRARSDPGGTRSRPRRPRSDNGIRFPQPR